MKVNCDKIKRAAESIARPLCATKYTHLADKFPNSKSIEHSCRLTLKWKFATLFFSVELIATQKSRYVAWLVRGKIDRILWLFLFSVATRKNASVLNLTKWYSLRQFNFLFLPHSSGEIQPSFQTSQVFSFAASRLQLYYSCFNSLLCGI